MNKKVFIYRMFVFFLYFFCTACNFSKCTFKDQDIIGFWHEDCKEGTCDAQNYATLEFKEDGSFKATNIPNDYLGYLPFTSSLRFDADGNWTLELSDDILGINKINLRFNPIIVMDYPIYNSSIYISGTKCNFTLYSWTRDPSERITFVKESIKK